MRIQDKHRTFPKTLGSKTRERGAFNNIPKSVGLFRLASVTDLGSAAPPPRHNSPRAWSRRDSTTALGLVARYIASRVASRVASSHRTGRVPSEPRVLGSFFCGR